VTAAAGRGGVVTERARRWHVRDTGRGVLESEEHLTWTGPWPPAPALAGVPALLEQLHFRSVERFSLGLLRCRRRGGRVECRFLGRWPGLAFADGGTTRRPDRVERSWTIAPGFLARPVTGAPAPTGHGTLVLGVERLADGRLHAWARVEGFPARLLGPAPFALAPFGRPWAWLGRLYTAVHSAAAFRCLRGLARSLGGDA
jgi:hypothetical protein